jgi:hypothetical protein
VVHLLAPPEFNANKHTVADLFALLPSSSAAAAFGHAGNSQARVCQMGINHTGNG